MSERLLLLKFPAHFKWLKSSFKSKTKCFSKQITPYSFSLEECKTKEGFSTKYGCFWREITLCKCKKIIKLFHHSIIFALSKHAGVDIRKIIKWMKKNDGIV